MGIDSFLVSLMFDEKKTQASADKVNAITKNMVKSVIGSVAVFASYSFLKSMVNDFADGAAEAGKFASSVHSDVEAVDALCQSLASVDGDVNAFKGSLGNLNNQIQEASKGKNDSAAMFKKLGVAVKDANGNIRETDKVLLDLSDKFASMNEKQQLDLASKLGIDKKSLDLVKQGKATLSELIEKRKADGVVTAKQVALSKEYKQLLWDIDNAYKQVKNKIAEAMMPYVLKFLKSVKDLTNYLKEHKGLVVGFFSAIGTALLVYLAPALAKTTLQVYKFTASLLTNPVFLIIAAVIALGAAIALLVDDFMVWKEGGESSFGAVWEVCDGFFTAIGDFIETNKQRFMAFGKAVVVGLSAFLGIKLAISLITGLRNVMMLARTAALGFNAALTANPIGLIIAAVIALIAVIYTFRHEIWSAMKFVVDAVRNAVDGFVGDFKAGIDGICQAANRIADFFSGVWQKVKNKALDIWNSIVAFITDKIEWVMGKIKAITDLKDKVVGFVKSAGEVKDKVVNVVKSANAPTVAKPSAATSVANSSMTNNKKTEVNTTTTVQKVEVNIQNGDPQAIARGVGGALQKNLVPNFNGSFA